MKRLRRSHEKNNKKVTNFGVFEFAVIMNKDTQTIKNGKVESFETDWRNESKVNVFFENIHA